MEKQKAMFNELVSHVTELCFDKCVAALRSPRSDGSSGSNSFAAPRCVAKPGSKLDSSEQACISNCSLRACPVLACRNVLSSPRCAPSSACAGFLESTNVVLQRIQRSK
jgi:hypothetical protein